MKSNRETNQRKNERERKYVKVKKGMPSSKERQKKGKRNEKRLRDAQRRMLNRERKEKKT